MPKPEIEDKPVRYIAQTGITDDPTGRRWETGDPVLSGELPPATIKWLLHCGAIVEE